MPRGIKLSPVQWVFLGLILLVALLFRDYGQSFDEAVHLNYGDWILAWYASGGKVNSALTALSCRYYSGLADVLMQFWANLGTILFSWDPFEERHFLNALIGLLGVFYAFRTGRLLGGMAVGVLAAVFLLLTPRWFGHMFDDPKDIPFAGAYVASLFYLLQPWYHSRVYDGRQCLKIGLAIAAALGTRIGGVFLYPILLLSLLAWSWWSGSVYPSRGSGDSVSHSWKAMFFFTLSRLLLIWSISWFVMLLFWPYGLVSPIWHPLEVIRVMADYPWGGNVFFRGGIYPVANLPSSYLPVWLLISLPEYYFLGLGLALFLVLPLIVRRRLTIRLASPYIILVLAVLLPAFVIVLVQSALYDGMRHVLFMVPPLAILAALGVGEFWRKYRLPFLRLTLSLVVGVTLLLVLYDLVTLHPYETIYFNRLFAGGVKRGLTQFDGDYWGQTYLAGANWISQHYPTESFNVGAPYMAKRLGFYFDRQIQVAARRRWLLEVLHGRFQRPPLVPPRIRVVGPDWDGISRESSVIFDRRDFKFYLSGIQFHCNELVPGKVLFSVVRQGVVLLEVKAVEPK